MFSGENDICVVVNRCSRNMCVIASLSEESDIQKCIPIGLY